LVEKREPDSADAGGVREKKEEKGENGDEPAFGS
jgi:hypothetical protein